MKDLTIVKQGKATTVQDRSGKWLTEERQILKRWTEYCSELYNRKANGDPPVLHCPLKHTQDDHLILRKEIGAAIQSLKKGKSAGVDKIRAELVQASGLDVITALMTICSKIWQIGERPTPLTQSLVSTLPKKGNLQQCQNCRTISIISAGFRAGRSTTEQIFNLQILCEKYLQHQQDLTVSSQTSRMSSTGFGIQLWGQPWRSTTSAQTLSKSSKTSITRPLVPSSSTAASELVS